MTGRIRLILKLFILLIIHCNVFAISKYDISGIRLQDTLKTGKTEVNSKPGGFFIAPSIGLDYPLKVFNDNSGVGLSYGAKIEFASLSIYPFVVYAEYQYQNNPGKDQYKTVNLLNSLETTINSFGGGFYFLANKYLKSNFTMPFFIAGIKSMSVKRVYSPESAVIDINKEDNVLLFSAGMGFTLYIFDLIGTYNYAKDYSSISIKTQFHFPVIKF